MIFKRDLLVNIKFLIIISLPISLVIFSVFDTVICKIFHQKRVQLIARGLGSKKIAEFSGLIFFLGQHESV